MVKSWHHNPIPPDPPSLPPVPAPLPPPQVKARQIWGDMVYTSDSDVVAVLMHLGYFAYYLAHPPACVAEFRAHVRLLPPRDKYATRARFVKSRAWCSSTEVCSYQVRGGLNPKP